MNPLSISGFWRCGLAGPIRCAIAILALRLAISGHAGETNLEAQLDLIPENQPLLTESLLWTEAVTLRSGAGYRDNVLLSAVNSRGSGFFTSGLDLMFYRLPLDGWEVILFASGDDLRYWNDAGTANEDFWIGSAQVNRHFNDHWQAGLAVQGFYQDQVLDAAAGGQIVSQPTNYLGKGVIIKPSVRHDFSHRLWLQFEGTASRLYYRSPLDDQWRGGGILTAGWDYGHKSELTLSYDSQMEFDDDTPDANAQGTALPGTHLSVWRNRVQLADKHYFDEAARWRARTRINFDFYRDNGSGFYDFDAYGAAEELRWQANGWSITGSAGIVYLRNPVQTATLSPSPSLLFRNIVDCTFRIERQVWKNLKFYAQYDLEHALSNDPSGKYNANSSLGGLEWDF